MTAGALTGGRWRWAGPGCGFRPATEPPGLHVIDSWLVSDGRVRAFGMHAERFGAACSELFALPWAHTATFLCAAMTQIPSRGRWFPRVELVAQGGEPHFQLWVRPAPPRGKTVRLWISDKPDLRHRPTVKGTDLNYLLELRRLAVTEGADEALIVSPDRRVREGSTTSILWWRGNTLCVPPLSANLLAGVTRALLLDAVSTRGLRVATESPTPTELDGLEVWAVNALHGIRPVAEWIGTSIETGPATRAARWNAYLDGLAVPHPADRLARGDLIPTPFERKQADANSASPPQSTEFRA
ncbi:MAG: aminotransferase class IV [Pseudonocardiales bacterium]|nr:aminotransferase class IV [Pseudonocardiales bacterium]